MKSFRFLFFGLALLIACAAQAQWVWLDKDGRRVFSDRGPGADIPEKSILRRPAGATRAVDPAPPVEAAGAASAAKPNSPPGPKIAGRDGDLEAKKKKAEDEEAAKRKAEEERVAASKVDNCARAKRSLATLQSGVRISTVNDKGERQVLDQAARDAETKRAQDLIASDCK